MCGTWVGEIPPIHMGSSHVAPEYMCRMCLHLLSSSPSLWSLLATVVVMTFEDLVGDCCHVTGQPIKLEQGPRVVPSTP